MVKTKNIYQKLYNSKNSICKLRLESIRKLLSLTRQQTQKSVQQTQKSVQQTQKGHVRKKMNN